MKSILVINGPNLNLLGQREAEHYGTTTLDEIETHLQELAAVQKLALAFFQSNHEGQLVERIQQAQQEQVGCMIINAAAYTHTSIAIYDALKAVKIPFIEVHLSNIFAREGFRHHSYLSPIAAGGIFGLGAESYYLAFQAAVNILKNHEK
jgi:3-dehydroquinate dehydratase-2